MNDYFELYVKCWVITTFCVCIGLTGIGGHAISFVVGVFGGIFFILMARAYNRDWGVPEWRN